MFFNKSKFSATKLSDQVEIKPNVAFSLPLQVIDSITYSLPTSVSATIIKSSGRDIVTLPTVLTITGSEYTRDIAGTISNTDWDGIAPLNLKVLIDNTFTVIIPLKV